MRIAAIDVGTNTAKLLVADCDHGELQALHEEERFVRLGEGLEASGRIGPAALERLGQALRAYREIAERHDAEQTVVAGTSASRAAKNREELARLVREATGDDLEVLSGEEEAELCFAGVVSAVEVERSCAVVDIGGGSTEVIVGEGHTAAVRHRTSVEVGTVRLTERFFERQPPKESAVQMAEDFILRLFRDAALPVDSEMPLIGASGTTTALAAVHSRSDGRRATSLKVLAADEVRRWCERLLSLSFDEVMALHPEAMQGRADVFPAGVLILNALMQHFGLRTCRISRRELRHGLVLRCAGGDP